MKIYILCNFESSNHILKKMFEKVGYEIQTYQLARDMLRDVYEDTPDAIISDINPPDIYGREIIIELRKRKITIPIAFLTSETNDKVYEKLLPYQNFQKPISFFKVINYLEQCLLDE